MHKQANLNVELGIDNSYLTNDKKHRKVSQNDQGPQCEALHRIHTKKDSAKEDTKEDSAWKSKRFD